MSFIRSPTFHVRFRANAIAPQNEVVFLTSIRQVGVVNVKGNASIQPGGAHTEGLILWSIKIEAVGEEKPCSVRCERLKFLA
jgi:hypothetical protein